MGVLLARISQAGQLFAEYRRHRFELFALVLPSADIHRHPHRERHHAKQQPDTRSGYDRSGLVVDNFVLDLLPFPAFSHHLENGDFAVLMEGDSGGFGDRIVVCNKLVII